ncbi:DUF6585 family protein [Spirillospora sp. NPDC047279]|uniref:DUF6585 family protein n=1 Tax=Spirillospora sp. NPDC047279 TaxID=3155478 RepID=UPI0033D79F1D
MDEVPEWVVLLAGEWRLGGLREVYRAKQRAVFGKWNDWRLYFYGEGLIVAGPEGVGMPFRWETVTVFQNLRTVNGAQADAAYTLVGPELEAVTIGRGTPAQLRFTVEGRRVPSVVRGAPFVYEGTWGPEIQAQVARVRLPGAVERLRRGEALDFGKLRIGGDGVSVKGKALAWAEVSDVQVGDGTLWVSDARRRSLPTVAVAEIPNFLLALNLLERLRG